MLEGKCPTVAPAAPRSSSRRCPLVPASTSTVRAARSTPGGPESRFRSSAMPPFTGTVPPHTPLPAPNGTTAICRSAAYRTTCETSAAEAGQATTSGGCGATAAFVHRSERGQQSRDVAQRSAAEEEAAPLPNRARRSLSSALPRAPAPRNAPVTYRALATLGCPARWLRARLLLEPAPRPPPEACVW